MFVMPRPPLPTLATLVPATVRLMALLLYATTLVVPDVMRSPKPEPIEE